MTYFLFLKIAIDKFFDIWYTILALNIHFQVITEVFLWKGRQDDVRIRSN